MRHIQIAHLSVQSAFKFVFAHAHQTTPVARDHADMTSALDSVFRRPDGHRVDMSQVMRCFRFTSHFFHAVE